MNNSKVEWIRVLRHHLIVIVNFSIALKKINILLLINCHYRYVTANFQVTLSVKYPHSVAHSFDHYRYSLPHHLLSLVLHHYFTYTAYCISSSRFSQCDDLLICLLCGRNDMIEVASFIWICDHDL